MKLWNRFMDCETARMSWMNSGVLSGAKSLTDQVLSFEPKAVCTDGLAIYQSLFPKAIHKIGPPGTRHIERHNLNIRTHIKRLSRRTICFSKSLRMLQACLRIYFWGTSYLPIPWNTWPSYCFSSPVLPTRKPIRCVPGCLKCRIPCWIKQTWN